MVPTNLELDTHVSRSQCKEASVSGASARNARDRASASTSAEGANVRNARDRASASTSASGADARNARDRASASTSDEGANASICSALQLTVILFNHLSATAPVGPACVSRWLHLSKQII